MATKKILHIGNIANNGYLNSRIMRRAGLESYNLVLEYYHFMACPEWEEGKLLKPLDSDYKPDWIASGYQGPERPYWFYQGSFRDVFYELLQQHKFKNNPENLISSFRNALTKLQFFYKHSRLHRWVLLFLGAYKFIKTPDHADSLISDKKWVKRHLLIVVILFLKWVNEIQAFMTKRLGICLHDRSKQEDFDRRVNELCEISAKLEGHGVMAVRPEDFEPYRFLFDQNRAILKKYDLIVAYATDGILPLLASHSYIAFEHGTIRKLPFENTVNGRICRLVYKLADAVLITNCDNNIAAKKLGLKHANFIPHPINEDVSDDDFEKSLSLRRDWDNLYDNPIVIFYPPRHHWDDKRNPDWEKGNDLFIKALARLRDDGVNFLLVTVELGMHVNKSKTLIKKLDLIKHVKWIKPLPHHQLVSYMIAADLIADQFNVPSFGGIPPKALMLKKPVLTSYSVEMHEWCFSEPPPFITCCSNEDSIYRALVKAVASDTNLKQLGFLGHDWYQKHYSNKLVLETFLKTFKKLP